MLVYDRRLAAAARATGLAVSAPDADRPTAITLDDVVAEQHAARRDLLA